MAEIASDANPRRPGRQERRRRCDSRVGRRHEPREAEDGGNPIQAGIGAAETLIAQGLAISKTPLDLLRGSGGEEKVLENAKNAAATEAPEIATYTAIERPARDTGEADREPASA